MHKKARGLQHGLENFQLGEVAWHLLIIPIPHAPDVEGQEVSVIRRVWW